MNNKNNFSLLVLALTGFYLTACSTTDFSTKAHRSTNISSNTKKIVIAHRGASGYLPEHTIAAKALAYGVGSDYLEQDLVMTKDDQVIVMHDYRLETVTNVREVYPKRHRKDGSYYVIDFTLAELRQLSILERFNIKNNHKVPVFKGRFPLNKSHFEVHTFEEEIELIQGLNQSTGKSVGIYPEIKNPNFHKKEGKDISLAVLNILKNYGYQNKTDKVFLQCFDASELKRINNDLFPQMGIDLKLVQLIKAKKNYQWMLSEKGMQQVAKYAEGVGPNIHQIIDKHSSSNSFKVSSLVANAHQSGLLVHPYTFRSEANNIPAYAQSFEDLVTIFLYRVGVDGIFTDFPDLALKVVDAHKMKNN